MKVAFAGQRGAYSEAAAAALFPFDIATVPMPTINEVFDSLIEGDAWQAVVPVEKSESGYISATYERLRKSRLYITSSAILSTEYVLASASGGAEDAVARIYGHPHALTACENYLRARPHVELAPRFDFLDVEGTGGNGLAQGFGPGEALLCSRFAALRRGLHILNENCSNQKDAFTRYVSVSKEPRVPTVDEGSSLTTVFFEIEDRPGALMRKLAVFAELGLNVVRLKVFQGGSNSSAAAFLTYLGRYTEVAAGRALEVIQSTSPHSRHLGSYSVQDLRGKF